jgi:hypothetical protein
MFNCAYAGLVLDGRQWTGFAKDEYTSVAEFTVCPHFTQRYPCPSSGVQARTGFCKRTVQLVTEQWW